ncbi:hypothetical protein An12g02175 [Aspergillus niger]|uniref:Uncharacterized protein n=2 Tax=Aspergillus niger TaxID=5061 RepID=A2QYR4_ASPNC|nr:hypothetical protein An12g02175 [Aspergillus niger]CAK41063.1 hypothetical protein An12g02175 [Aspergillus niger]
MFLRICPTIYFALRPHYNDSFALAPWQTQDQTEDEKPTHSQSYNQENAQCRSMGNSSSSYYNESNKILLAIYSCGRILHSTASAVLPSFSFFGRKSVRFAIPTTCYLRIRNEVLKHY